MARQRCSRAQALRSATLVLLITLLATAATAAAGKQQLGPLLAAMLTNHTAPVPALGSHEFTPLSNGDIAVINGALQPEPDGAPYVYDTGLPSTLASLTNSSAVAHTLSWDRLQLLAADNERVSWLVRTYIVCGEALLKLTLSREIQMIIRDAVTASISAVVDVPQRQVVTFASSNISMALSFAGVRWPNTSKSLAEATPDSHAGLAAVRDALSQLAGGYHKGHIHVSFKSSSLDDTTSLAPLPSQAVRKLLQQQHGGSAPARQQQQQQSDGAAPVVVFASFHDMAPANATSLLRRLASTCAPRAPGEHVAAASLAAGSSVTRVCANTFRLAFQDHGVGVSSPAAFSVTPVVQPQASVALSVAVALTSSQLSASDKLDEHALAWLNNSSAVQDILQDLDLKAVPSSLLSLLNTTASELAAAAEAEESSNNGGGGGLSGLLPLLLQQGSAAASAPATGGPISRGVVAGIAVASAVSLLALIGVGVLLVWQRQPARASKEQLPTSAQGSRRKKRPGRMYQTKYLTPLPGVLAAAPAPPPEEEEQEEEEEVAAERPHIERGDSVSSAVQFEADGMQASGDDGEQQPESSDGTSSSSSRSSLAARQQHTAAAVGRSASARMAAVPAAAAAQAAQQHANCSTASSSSTYRQGDGMVPCAAVCTGTDVAANRRQLASAAAAMGHHASAATSAFAAMGAQLAAAGGSAGGDPDAVQPLGNSCWHQHGAACGWGALEPGELQQQLQRRTGAALVSPFAGAFSIASEASASSSAAG